MDIIPIWLQHVFGCLEYPILFTTSGCDFHFVVEHHKPAKSLIQNAPWSSRKSKTPVDRSCLGPPLCGCVKATPVDVRFCGKATSILKLVFLENQPNTLYIYIQNQNPVVTESAATRKSEAKVLQIPPPPKKKTTAMDQHGPTTKIKNPYVQYVNPLAPRTEVKHPQHLGILTLRHPATARRQSVLVRLSNMAQWDDGNDWQIRASSKTSKNMAFDLVAQMQKKKRHDKSYNSQSYQLQQHLRNCTNHPAHASTSPSRPSNVADNAIPIGMEEADIAHTTDCWTMGVSLIACIYCQPNLVELNQKTHHYNHYICHMSINHLSLFIFIHSKHCLLEYAGMLHVQVIKSGCFGPRILSPGIQTQALIKLRLASATMKATTHNTYPSKI